MYCIKCGSENADEAVYCLKCGNKFEETPEQETIVSASAAGTDTGPERKLFSIRPTLMFVKIGYGLAVIGAFLLVAVVSFLTVLVGIQISALYSVFAGLCLLLIPAFFHIKQKMVLYTLTDSKVTIDKGLISRTTRNVPLRIIQDVTVTANVFQRMLGLGDVEIENANENDDTILLRNINSPKETAEALLKQMRLLNK